MLPEGVRVETGTKLTFPWHILLFGLIVCFGLFVQFVALEAAFDLLGLGIVFSRGMALFFMATLVAVASVITLSDQSDVKISAMVVAVVVIIVSGILNFTWVDSELPELNLVQTLAFSECPLFVLCRMLFVTCAELKCYLGREL